MDWPSIKNPIPSPIEVFSEGAGRAAKSLKEKSRNPIGDSLTNSVDLSKIMRNPEHALAPGLADYLAGQGMTSSNTMDTIKSWDKGPTGTDWGWADKIEASWLDKTGIGQNGGGGGGGGGGAQITDIPMPELPAFSSMLDGQGNLKSEFNFDPSLINADDERFKLDNTAYDMLSQIGQGKTDVPWLADAKAAQGISNLQLLENAKKEAASGAAAAQANLAMTGGLRSGARERLGAQGIEQGLMASQNARRQGNLANLGLDVEGGKQQMDILSALPGLDVARKGYGAGLEQFNIGQQNLGKQFNIGTLSTDLARKGQHDQFGYGEKMKFKGAKETADAIRSSGGRGWFS